MVMALSHECELILEVGPGTVLSKLSNAITDGHGPVCLPIESKAGNDLDLNRVLGEWFVRGGTINWEELYEGRLVRPFIPASERIFIENPCERPFALEHETQHTQHLRHDNAGSNSEEALANAKNPFSDHEIDYIRRLIRSELQGGISEAKNKLTSVIYYSPTSRKENTTDPN